MSGRSRIGLGVGLGASALIAQCHYKKPALSRRVLQMSTDGSAYGSNGGIAVVSTDPRLHFWGKVRNINGNSVTVELAALCKALSILKNTGFRDHAEIFVDCDSIVSKLYEARLMPSGQRANRNWLGSSRQLFLKAADLLDELEERGVKVVLKRPDTNGQPHRAAHRLARAAAGCHKAAFNPRISPEDVQRVKELRLPEMGAEPKVQALPNEPARKLLESVPANQNGSSKQ